MTPSLHWTAYTISSHTNTHAHHPKQDGPRSYTDLTSLLIFKIDNRLSPGSQFYLVLRTKPRNHCTDAEFISIVPPRLIIPLNKLRCGTLHTLNGVVRGIGASRPVHSKKNHKHHDHHRHHNHRVLAPSLLAKQTTTLHFRSGEPATNKTHSHLASL